MTKKKQSLAREVNVADAASEAIGELLSLAEEMREWANNLEEKFFSTAKYDAVSATADTLESVSEPDYPEAAKQLIVKFTDLPRRKRGHSRATRCGQACYVLTTCVEAMEENSDLEELSTALQEIIDECEGLEFPGMYG